MDNENRIVGIITVDDILDVIDQESTEDIHKMALCNLRKRIPKGE